MKNRLASEFSRVRFAHPGYAGLRISFPVNFDDLMYQKVDTGTCCSAF